jgi:hypothetical protein
MRRSKLNQEQWAALAEQFAAEALSEALRRATLPEWVGYSWDLKLGEKQAPEDGYVIGPDGDYVPFHPGQQAAWETDRRWIVISSGTQAGKTVFVPWWLAREIQIKGPGDYVAVTSTKDLFKRKFLPELLNVFENILGIARYWRTDGILELMDPVERKFHGRHAADPDMWGRIILGSAQALPALEAMTAKAAVLDECGQPEFSDKAHKAIRRRLAIHRGRGLYTTTLYEPGWFTNDMVDAVEEGGDQTIEMHGPAELSVTDNERENAILIQFDSIINPTYPMAEFEEARTKMPDDEFQMFWRGRVAKYRHLIYDEFSKKEHTCDPIPIPKAWKLHVGLDFGPVNTAALFYAEDPSDGQWYAFAEYLGGGILIEEHARKVLDIAGRHPDTCYGGSKSEEQWRREFENGGLKVRVPRISDVWIGINSVRSQHKQNKIIYFNTLKGIIRQKETYRRKLDREKNPTREIENKNAYHYLDAERYVVSSELGSMKGWSRGASE